jgi:hypothetical protein
MIKMGQRVCLNYNMQRKGTVVHIQFVKPQQLSSSGPTADRQICSVQFDDGLIENWPTNDLRPEW